ncbi:ABC transporter substrate-binding protein [Paeniglutamicibacter cryotolerans]|uniref:Uncharacterized protein n=1 Tax=Paeniglutamicibacter cryotolerans TaxID=670079 RepID=A0A839QLM7_9MICC|nr:ABC transporter substrate-binding protein [Paeniglutamicibacter cryotolerans]MBB2994916.1 hypothetical protein [Paeniglutamicibacter cryotolerans]
MSQPIDAGSVLGGRYQVTELILTSADGDLVLDGIDQVLNRPVSILLGSAENSSQLTASAREIANGARFAAMQVLDLGISGGRSYLVTNLADAADLLDLVIQTDAPYVEPFFTDTLGSEIFGVSRSTEPQTYADDEEYYEDLDAQEEGRPAMLGRLPEFNLNDQITGLKGRFARGRSSAGTPVADDSYDSHTAPSELLRQETEETGENNAVFPPAPAALPKVQRIPATPPTPVGEPVVTSTAALASAARSRGAGIGPDGQRNATTFPAAARDYAEAEEPYVDYEEEEAGEGRNKTMRLLVGAVLCIVLVVAVVFAFNALGPKAPGPVANSSPVGTTEGSSPGGSTAPVTTAKPVINGVTRLVPGNQGLNADTDGTLSRLIDGNPASIYRSYSFSTPKFGGLASNMVLVAELKKPSDVSKIELVGLNGSGGAFEIRVGKTDSLADSSEVSSGSFTGPTVTVPVPSGDNGGTGVQYVFVNVTELPKLASGGNNSRPYGLQIGEIKVS